MAWELGSFAHYYDELVEALESMTPDQLATALANDDYERNPRFDNYLRPARWHREISKKWYDGRKGYYLKFCPAGVLVLIAVERIERTNTQDNGGGVIWIDKDGLSRVELPDTREEI